MHHLMLFRCLGWRKRNRENHTTYFARALVKTDSESIDVTVRAQTKDTVRGIRGAHGRGALAEEGDVWGDDRG